MLMLMLLWHGDSQRMTTAAATMMMTLEDINDILRMTSLQSCI